MVAVPVTVCPPGDVKVTLRSLPLALASDNGTYKVTCLDCTEVNVIVVGTGRAAVEGETRLVLHHQHNNSSTDPLRSHTHTHTQTHTSTLQTIVVCAFACTCISMDRLSILVITAFYWIMPAYYIPTIHPLSKQHILILHLRNVAHSHSTSTKHNKLPQYMY